MGMGFSAARPSAAPSQVSKTALERFITIWIIVVGSISVTYLVVVGIFFGSR